MKGLTEEQLHYAEELISIMKDGVQANQAKGRYTRGAHAKTLDLLKAEFRVEEDIPEECKVGVFAEPRTYKAFVRASSSNPSPASDKKKDARGMAIKLLGVEGERFSEFNSEKATQDLIVISWPAFFFKDLKSFVPCARMFTNGQFLRLAGWLMITGQFKSIYFVGKAFKCQKSLLDIQFWSMTPYQLGEKFVKYTLIPRSAAPVSKPKPLNDAYLSQNMDAQLDEGEAVFDFCVQFYKNDKETSLTDNMQIWKESDSPYVKVATLTIPKQDAGTQERLTFGENLSYSPGHALAVHQPVGELNYARLHAYPAISEFRHGKNCCPVFEPTEKDYDEMV